MKRFISILFFVVIALLPIGLLLRVQHLPGSNLLFILGFLGLIVYFTTRTVKDFMLKRIDRNNIFLQIFTVLMSVILFSKYFYHSFGDYPGLLIIPLFIVMSAFYLIKGKTRYIKLTIAVFTYLLLSIPLFGLDFHDTPRRYIPKSWYNRYDVHQSVPVTLPYSFQFKETKELNSKAFDLKKSKDFYSAILIYRQALKLEPQNSTLLFDISDCYARVNDLETAIAVLDTAILIDSTNGAFYNNRGLLYYHLNTYDKAINDFEKAIQIDSTQSTFYANLAFAFYYNNLFEQSCEAVQKAEKLELKNHKGLEQIKKEKCE